MREILERLFDLDKVRHIAERNINSNDVWEDETWVYTVVDVLVDGAHGAYIPIIVLEMFGKEVASQNPYDARNEFLHDDLFSIMYEAGEVMTELIGLRGTFFFDYYETDGSFCLFYMEEGLPITVDGEETIFTLERLNNEGFEFEQLPTNLPYTYVQSYFYPAFACLVNNDGTKVLAGYVNKEGDETYLDELVLTDIYYTEYPDSESNEDVPAFDWGSEVFFIQDFLAPWTT